MSNFTRVLARAAAAAAATALVTAGGLAPALADDGDGVRNGAAQDRGASADHPRQGPKSDKGEKANGEKANGEKTNGEKANGAQDKGDRGQGDVRGNGHTPVTVCHLLGNGGYHVLTFDDNALEAHVDHGDIYPVPAEGCPASSDDVEQPTFRGEPGHVRVTVCHVLGNGGYHELTFDEHALRAHEAHGDLYPVPAGGCPEETPGETPEETVPGTTQSDDTPGDDSQETPVVEGDTATDDATVAGVEQFASDTTPRTGQVLGTEAVAGVNRTAPVAGPLAGVLPQTGAGRLGLAAGLGLAMIGAGAALVARRRAQTI